MIDDKYDWWKDVIEADDIESTMETGIQDKNGNQIFEGDVINISRFNYSSIKPFLIKSKSNWLVQYNIENACFEVQCDNYRGHSFLSFFQKREIETIEVVGNIYENPSLVE